MLTGSTLTVLGREARDDFAEVVFRKGCRRIDLAGQESLAEGAEGDKSDAQFLADREHLGFWRTSPKRIFALHRRHGLDGVRSANRLHAGLR